MRILFIILVSLNCIAQTGKVLKIKDGDTFVILSNNTETTVRVNAIDCPEYNQNYGKEATEFTTKKCLNKNVALQTFGTDKYGRILANVILDDSASLADYLLINGLAWHYTKYDSQSRLDSLQAIAMINKAGLWSDPMAVAPWEFRHPSIAISDSVYVCDSNTSVAYHKTDRCRGLTRCTHTIIHITKANAERRNKRACKICY